MIDDDRRRESGEVGAQRMPCGWAAGYECAPALPSFQTLAGDFQALSYACEICCSLITKAQSNAAHSASVHVVERRFRRLVVDHCDAARASAELADAVDHDRVVRSVRRRLHDDDA